MGLFIELLAWEHHPVLGRAFPEQRRGAEPPLAHLLEHQGSWGCSRCTHRGAPGWLCSAAVPEGMRSQPGRAVLAEPCWRSSSSSQSQLFQA